MDIQKAYIVMQKEFKKKVPVGSKVKVLRKAKDFELGWDNVWVKEMDSTVNNVYEVLKYNDYGVLLSINTRERLYYPFFVLKLIKLRKKNINLNLLKKC